MSGWYVPELNGAASTQSLGTAQRSNLMPQSMRSTLNDAEVRDNALQKKMTESMVKRSGNIDRHMERLFGSNNLLQGHNSNYVQQFTEKSPASGAKAQKPSESYKKYKSRVPANNTDDMLMNHSDSMHSFNTQTNDYQEEANRIIAPEEPLSSLSSQISSTKVPTVVETFNTDYGQLKHVTNRDNIAPPQLYTGPAL
jgi:hypothetical protein